MNEPLIRVKRLKCSVRRFGRFELACVIGMTTILLNSCGLNYHLQGQGTTAMLIPPGAPAGLKGTPAISTIRVSNARSRPSALDGCDIRNDLLELRWDGNTAGIQLKSESY